jgi:hypothetical protein
VPLRNVVQQYPIPEASIRGAINQKVAVLGWQPEQLEQFIREVFEKSVKSLETGDWSLLLFELQLQDG